MDGINEAEDCRVIGKTLPKPYELALDDTEFQSTLQRLLDLSEMLAEVRDGFIHLFDELGSASRLGIFVEGPASLTNQVVLRFQTSDCFLDLLSALETAKPHLLRTKELIRDIGSH